MTDPKMSGPFTSDDIRDLIKELRGANDMRPDPTGIFGLVNILGAGSEGDPTFWRAVVLAPTPKSRAKVKAVEGMNADPEDKRMLSVGYDADKVISRFASPEAALHYLKRARLEWKAWAQVIADAEAAVEKAYTDRKQFTMQVFR